MSADNLRVVIVEDQPALATEIKSLLERHPGFTYLATASSVVESLIVIPACSPDLVILDVELGDGTAFDILRSLAPTCFKVIFVTAFQDYAIKAIKVGALDYLVKPIDPLEFQSALLKIRSTAPPREQVDLALQQLTTPSSMQRIALRSGGIVKIVPVDQIMFLESGNGTIFHLADKQRINTNKTIKDFEDILPVRDFVRIHASTLVNVAFIDQYRPTGSVVLKDGTTLEVAARRRDGLVAYLTR